MDTSSTNIPNNTTHCHQYSQYSQQQQGNHSHNPTSHLSHDQPRNKPSTNSNNHSDYAQYRKQIPCKFWMHAGCNRGDTCYYKHNILEESVLAHVADHIIASVEAKMTRIMHIALDAQTKSITNITQNQIDHMESRIIQTLRKDLVKTMENQQTKRNKTYQNNLTKLAQSTNSQLKSIRSSTQRVKKSVSIKKSKFFFCIYSVSCTYLPHISYLHHICGISH
eukprot:749690_1